MKGTWQTDSSSGSGAAVAVVAGVVVLIGSGGAAAIARAASDVLTVVLIVLGCLAAVAVAAVVGLLALRRRYTDPQGTTPMSFASPEQIRAIQARSAPRREIPAQVHNHVHIHGVLTDEQLGQLGHIIGRKEDQ